MNTSLNSTVTMYATNQSGAPLSYGDVVIPSDASNKSVETIADINYAGPVGVVVDPGGIAAGALGAIAFQGYCPRINLITSAALRDGLVISASAGKATVSASSSGAAFGMALSTGTTPEAILFGRVPPAETPGYEEVGGRLTLSSGLPVVSSDVSGAATLYYTPYNNGRIGLYSGGAWELYTTAEISVSLAAILDATNYDVFAYYTGSAVALELLAWTDATTRATALARQDGIYTKSGDATRRYLGTIRASGAGTCDDSHAKRFVWNAYNRVRQPLIKQDATESWTYSTNAWRMANGSAANRVEIVVGLVDDVIDITVNAFPTGSVTGGVGVAISEDADATPTFDNQLGGYGVYMIPSTATPVVWSRLTKRPAIGYHYYQWVEWGRTGLSWYGTYGGGVTTDPELRSGIIGWFEG